MSNHSLRRGDAQVDDKQSPVNRFRRALLVVVPLWSLLIYGFMQLLYHGPS